MRYPKFLKEDSVITLVAPSYGCTTSPYKEKLIRAHKFLLNEGFNVVFGPNYFETYIGRSNTKELCAKEIMDYYDRTDLLLSVGGGELETEILEGINFNTLRASDPVFFMGYSDNTNLTFTLTTICDVATIYGPNAPEFGSYSIHQSLHYALDLLRGDSLTFEGFRMFELNSNVTADKPYEDYNLTEEKILRNYPKDQVSFEGRLVGGCLDTLTGLVGTRFDRVEAFSDRYRKDRIIWFLESCDLDVFGIRRSLLQLKRAGWFNHVSGFIIGRPLHFGEVKDGLDQYQAVLEVISEFNVPVIMDADLGHLKPTIPILCGAYAKVEANDNIKIEYILK